MTDPRNAIEIDRLHKSFSVPVHRVESFKERVVHPFRSVEYTQLPAVHDVSFDVRAGEFFGIVGRNGSGKTTLLKLLASIYKPDRGSIRMAGRVAPFIELGVGFNPNLAARDNILLNGVMMGLTPKDAETRFDRVIEFAELEEFVELKLKNYSSGMRVRLGFAMLVEVDADVLLIDEVLAVGDAAFQQKCTDAFYDFKKQGRTIVLVTHAMPKLEEYCDRAVLLHEGKLECLGEPDAVGDRYLELNFKHELPKDADDDLDDASAGPATRPARIVSFHFVDADGRRADGYKHGEEIHFVAELEALADLDSLCFGLVLSNPEVWVAHLRTADLPEAGGTLRAGDRLQVRGRIENQLTSGRYFGSIGLTHHRESNDAIDAREQAANFLVYGAEAPGGYQGVIVPPHSFEVERSAPSLTPVPAPAAPDAGAATAARVREAGR